MKHKIRVACLILYYLAGSMLYFKIRDNAAKEPEAMLTFLGLLTFLLLLFKIMEGMVQRKQLAGASLKQIDHMTGIEFEQYLALLYRQAGFHVKTTPASYDYGADLLLEKRNLRGKTVKYVLQAKRYTGAVGEEAVQQAVTARMFYGYDKSIVCSNSTFTPAAKKLAKKTECILIGRYDLGKKLC